MFIPAALIPSRATVHRRQECLRSLPALPFFQRHDRWRRLPRRRATEGPGARRCGGAKGILKADHQAGNAFIEGFRRLAWADSTANSGPGGREDHGLEFLAVHLEEGRRALGGYLGVGSDAPEHLGGLGQVQFILHQDCAAASSRARPRAAFAAAGL